MKTLQKVLVCILLCILTMPVLAKNDVNSSIATNEVKVAVVNPLTFYVTAYKVRAYLHKTVLVPSYSYKYDIYIDVVEDNNTTPILMTSNVTMSATIQTHVAYSETISATVSAGNTSSPLVTFYADHDVAFSTEFLSHSISPGTYNGLPLYFGYTFMPF